MTKKILQWGKVQKLHILGWTIFIALEIGLIGLSVGYFGKPLNYALHYLLNILLFYSNAHFVLKKSFSGRNPWITVTVLMFAQICVYILLRSYLNHLLSGRETTFSILQIVNDHKNFFQSLWRGLFFIVLSCFYFLFLEFKQERAKREHSEKMRLLDDLKTKEIQNELTIAKYEYLRAQINPHLLFNTLSFLYDSIRKYNEEAGEVVLNLADLMRFSLETKHSGDGFPKLNEELVQVENLVSLNKIRKDQEQYLNIKISKNAKKFRFIPLVIITLVENMLKHGNLQKSEHPGELNIEIIGNKIKIRTINLINTNIHQSGFNKGMDNIQKRLSLAYREKFSFAYGKTQDNYFEVNLIVDQGL